MDCFIGWFLLEAARASGAQVEITERLTGLRVGDVMTQQFATVDANSNLETFVHEHLLPTGHRCFVVLEQGRPAGIITPHEVKAIDRGRWPYTTVGDALHKKPLTGVLRLCRLSWLRRRGSASPLPRTNKEGCALGSDWALGFGPKAERAA